jgi:hypothetical protein
VNNTIVQKKIHLTSCVKKTVLDNFSITYILDHKHCYNSIFNKNKSTKKNKTNKEKIRFESKQHKLKVLRV